MNSSSFFVERYESVIELLKKHGFWNLESGQYFLPLIRYCLPPPSYHHIEELLDNLIKCKVDTDWAPLKKMRLLKSRINHYARSEDKSVYGTIDVGTAFPIAFGIKRIADLPEWPDEVKRDLIIEFAEAIYASTGSAEGISHSDFYADVYQFRDVIIAQKASALSLKPHANTRKSLNDKVERVSRLLEGAHRFGNHRDNRRLKGSVWAEIPNIPFVLHPDELDEIAAGSSSSVSGDSFLNGTDHSDKQSNQSIQEQNREYEQIFSRLKWSRDNVRSLANYSQPQLTHILSYWESLLDKKRVSIFKMSLISLVTGLPKKRWEGCIDSSIIEPAHQNHIDKLWLDTQHNKIIYFVGNNATEFDEDATFNRVELLLPQGLKLSSKDIEDGLNEDRAVRDYNENNPGPSPRMNTIARAGHILLRAKLADETLAFTLSGQIPIEFKARSSYFSTTNQQVNQLFQDCFQLLISSVSLYKDTFPKTFLMLKDISFKGYQEPPAHPLGSQIVLPNWNFANFRITPYTGQKLENKIILANMMEVYFYWMVQYGLATRASGAETESHFFGDYWLYSDKDSVDYFESKTLLIPDLIKQQHAELLACREQLKSQITPSLQGLIENPSYPHIYYELSRGRLKANYLYSQNALSLTQQLFKLTPAFGRPNAHRHQCASIAHERLGEVHADTWLGHHIDGWHFSSPESSSTVLVLKELLQLQNQWLTELGFHLIKNPLVPTC